VNSNYFNCPVNFTPKSGLSNDVSGLIATCNLDCPSNTCPSGQTCAISGSTYKSHTCS